MDGSLQRWCLDSLASTRPGEIHDTEWMIETGAFRKLAGFRGLNQQQVLESNLATAQRADLGSLTDSCPLTVADPPEILGAIHELLVSRKGVSPTKERRSKSSVRRTGGVFYTPRPVIDYIIKQTLAARFEGANPDQVRSLRLLDPAAGSGAFLAVAYRYLLAWHLDWYRVNQPDSNAIVRTPQGLELSREMCQSILKNSLFGVDLDGCAIQVARRILWLIQLDSSPDSNSDLPMEDEFHPVAANLKQGHALIGTAFEESASDGDFPREVPRFDWADQFPQVASQGGFDIIVGNPPYRRERDFKLQMDQIGTTALGRYRSPRMDLWYYFVHRGIQLLRSGGVLSFITNAYWLKGTGADKLIEALKEEVHVDELFLLRNQPVFAGVSGQHLIFRLSKSVSETPTMIKTVPRQPFRVVEELFNGSAEIRAFTKPQVELFHNGFVDVWPSSDRLLDKLRINPPLKNLGVVRQGIAENPAWINGRTIDRFPDEADIHDWYLGEGVFSLRPDEVTELMLPATESTLLRPYHELCDLGRYWSAARPSRHLIYSTRQTCPEIAEFPAVGKHLARFQAILEARRETVKGSNQWWHLHWPRDERLWQTNKLVAVQMAARPSFVPTFRPTYVSFSANVFVQAKSTREDLRYLAGVLNSRILWAWFIQHAKHRGVGLELNGHVLEQAPIRRIDFDDPDDARRHDELVLLVEGRMKLERSRVEQSDVPAPASAIEDQIRDAESRIDTLVASLYRLDPEDLELVDEMIGR